MAIDFPNTPVTNEVFSVGDKTWRWDGAKWLTQSTSTASYLEIYDLAVLQNMETN